MRRDYHSFNITMGGNLTNAAVPDLQRASEKGGNLGLMEVDGLILTKISSFLWHSISIDSRLCGLVDSLIGGSCGSCANGRGAACNFDLLDWLLKKKNELEGDMAGVIL